MSTKYSNIHPINLTVDATYQERLIGRTHDRQDFKARDVDTILYMG